jgi:DNA-binding CsgD family transcriptional regulator
LFSRKIPDSAGKANKSTEKYSFTEEPQKFAVAFRQHWPLVLSVGFFFGWLLSFPMQGPLFSAIVQGRQVNPVFLTTMFLSGLILGFACAGIAGYFFRQKLQWFSLGAIPCAIISFFLNGIPAEYWLLLFALLGLFSGTAIISWMNAFAASVPLSQRGRTFVLAAVISNLILYLVTVLISHQLAFDRLLIITGLLPFAMLIFLVYGYRKTPLDMQSSPVEKNRAHGAGHPNFWQLFPFIFAIYAVGGLMYAVVGSLASPPYGLLSYYGLLPYIILLFLAGLLADKVGRWINGIIGAIIVGIGFMSVGLFTGPLQFVVIQTLLIGGYAFLDVFTWVIAADASNGRKIPLAYGAVLGINILAILVGVLLGERIDQLAEGSEILTVSLAGIFSFLSLVFIIRLRETQQPVPPAVTNMTPNSLEAIVQKFGLTPREADVVEILITGASTQEIRDKLVIAPDTLKRHLRNIYRKTGVRNRLEFTMAAMNMFDQPESIS